MNPSSFFLLLRRLSLLGAVSLAALWPLRTLGLELRRHTVEFSGQPMALWEKRPASPKAAILLLHGRTWSSRPDFDLQVPGEQRSLMEALAARGYAVYALDLPGYGESARLPDGWLSPVVAAEALAVALRWVAEQAGFEAKPALFGWSNGSMVAQLAVQRQPALVSALVLFGYPVDPAVRIPPASEPAALLRAATTAAGARSDFIVPGSISTAAMDAFTAAALAADPVRADWHRLEEWNELAPAKVRVPVLLLQGEFDPLSPTAALTRLFAQLGHPDRQWTVIAGGDHAALMENMQATFVSALVDFLERPRAP